MNHAGDARLATEPPTRWTVCRRYRAERLPAVSQHSVGSLGQHHPRNPASSAVVNVSSSMTRTGLAPRGYLAGLRGSGSVLLVGVLRINIGVACCKPCDVKIAGRPEGRPVPRVSRRVWLPPRQLRLVEGPPGPAAEWHLDPRPPSIGAEDRAVRSTGSSRSRCRSTLAGIRTRTTRRCRPVSHLGPALRRHRGSDGGSPGSVAAARRTQIVRVPPPRRTGLASIWCCASSGTQHRLTRCLPR